MNVRKVKRLCTVKGCKHTNCYAISRSSEMSGLVICADCLKDALKGVKELEKNGGLKVNTAKKVRKPEIPLFFHPAKSENKPEDKPNTEDENKKDNGGKELKDK